MKVLHSSFLFFYIRLIKKRIKITYWKDKFKKTFKSIYGTKLGREYNFFKYFRFKKAYSLKGLL